MENSLNNICKECSEKQKETCCHFKVFLTKKEIDSIKKIKPNLKYKKTRSGFSLVRDRQDSHFKCQFLTENGCCLPEELKPLDCLLFPMVLTYQKDKIDFYLNKDCPYIKFVPKEWIEKTKEWTLEKFKEWSQEEKSDYSKTTESLSKKSLLRI